MARFRGTVQGGRGQASRLGHSKYGLHVSAQAWTGEVCVHLFDHGDQGDGVNITIRDHGGGNGKVLFHGPMSELRSRHTVVLNTVQDQLLHLGEAA